MTKTLSERIAEKQKEFYSEYPNAKLSLNIQAKDAGDVADLVVEMFGLIDELQAENQKIQESEFASYKSNCEEEALRLERYRAEKEALLAKNGELEGSLKAKAIEEVYRDELNLKQLTERKALEAKVKELEGKVELVKIWFQGAALDHGFTKQSCRVNAEQIEEWLTPKPTNLEE